jgi:hypothetical protein
LLGDNKWHKKKNPGHHVRWPGANAMLRGDWARR